MFSEMVFATRHVHEGTPTIRLCCQSTERSRVVSIATHGLCLSDVTADCISTLDSVCEIQVFQHRRYQSCFSSVDAGASGLAILTTLQLGVIFLTLALAAQSFQSSQRNSRFIRRLE